MIHETEAKSILRRHERVDSWFISCYGMNLYRGCAHNCIYCDGRAETYQVDGEFGFPASILTKSMLVLRDIDIIKKIDEQNRAIVSFSLSSADDDISAVFEPGVSPPGKRLEAIRTLSAEGITKTSQDLIQEILETGGCSHYHQLLNYDI